MIERLLSLTTKRGLTGFWHSGHAPARTILRLPGGNSQMPELRSSAAGVLQYARDGSLAERISEQLRMSGHGVGPAERRSWERSLPILAQDLVDAGLGQVEILAEYQLPLTSKRVDAVLAGVHPHTGGDSYVVIELKQWSAATLYDEATNLVTVERVLRPRLHPGLQVAGYCDYLVDFLGALHDQPQAGVARR